MRELTILRLVAFECASLRARSASREVLPRQVIDDVEILLATGASIRGLVTDDRGQALAGVYVMARAVEVQGSGAVSDAFPGDTTNARGEFEIRGLDASLYQLDGIPLSTADALTDKPLIRTIVERVAVDSEVVIVVLRRGVSLRGTVVDASGAALLGYRVTALGPASLGPDFTAGSAATNAAGAFAIPVVAGDVYALELRGPPTTERGDMVLVTVPDVAAGTRGLVLTVPQLLPRTAPIVFTIGLSPARETPGGLIPRAEARAMSSEEPSKSRIPTEVGEALVRTKDELAGHAVNPSCRHASSRNPGHRNPGGSTNS